MPRRWSGQLPQRAAQTCWFCLVRISRVPCAESESPSAIGGASHRAHLHPSAVTTGLCRATCYGAWPLARTLSWGVRGFSMRRQGFKISTARGAQGEIFVQPDHWDGLANDETGKGSQKRAKRRERRERWPKHTSKARDLNQERFELRAKILNCSDPEERAALWEQSEGLMNEILLKTWWWGLEMRDGNPRSDVFSAGDSGELTPETRVLVQLRSAATRQLLENLSARGLSQIVNAMLLLRNGGWGETDLELLQALGERALDIADSFDFHQASFMLAVLTSLEDLKYGAELWYAMQHRAAKTAGTCDMRALSALFVTLETRRKKLPVLPVLLDASCKRACAFVDNLLPRRLGPLLLSLANLGAVPCSELVAAVTRYVEEKASLFWPVDIADLLVAFARMRAEISPSLATVLQGQVLNFAKTIGAQDLLRIVWALAARRAHTHPDFVEAVWARALVLAPIFQPQQCANLLRAAAMLDLKPPQSLVATLEARVLKTMGLCPAQSIAMLLVALARLAWLPSAAFLESAQAAACMRVRECEAQHVAQLLWSLAELRVSPEPAFSLAMARRTVVVCPRLVHPQTCSFLCFLLFRLPYERKVLQLASSFGPREIWKISVATAQLDLGSASAGLLRVLEVQRHMAVCHARDMLRSREVCAGWRQERALVVSGSFEVAPLVGFLSALSQIGTTPPSELALALMQRAAAIAPEFSAGQLFILMWALSRLRLVARPELMDAVQARATAVASDFKPKELSGLVVAMDHMGLSPSKECWAALEGQLVVIADMFTATDLSFMISVVSRARLRLGPDVLEALEARAVAVARHFEPIEVASLAAAVATMGLPAWKAVLDNLNPWASISWRNYAIMEGHCTMLELRKGFAGDVKALPTPRPRQQWTQVSAPAEFHKHTKDDEAGKKE